MQLHACRDDAELLAKQGRGEQVPMLFCCHMMPAPLPEALPPLDLLQRQPPSTDAILGRLQVPAISRHVVTATERATPPFCILPVHLRKAVYDIPVKGFPRAKQGPLCR